MKKTAFLPLGKSLARYASALAFCAAMAAGSGAARAATYYWDAGSGTNFNWDTATNWNPNSLPTDADDVFFPFPFPNPGSLANPFVITLGAADVAKSLNFLGNYTLTGGVFTLAAGNSVNTTLGGTVTIASKLSGSGVGINIGGGGGLRLTNTANDFTGTVAINNGSLIISNAAVLSADSTTILVNGSTTRGAGGGSLVLEGDYGTGVNLNRNVDLMGLGPIADRGFSLISVKNNTLSGTVSRSAANSLPTRIFSAGGLLTISGTLNIATQVGAQTFILGGINAVGAGNFAITGTLTDVGPVGTFGILEKTSAGTLILNPANTALFGGTIRLSTGSVRIVANNVLGTRTATLTNSVLDMNGGTLEVRMDAPAISAGGSPALVYGRANSTFFVDHSLAGTTINGTATLGTLTMQVGVTQTFNGRNGYGVAFPNSTVNGTGNNYALTNNLNGLLTFTGDFWSNPDNTGSRVMTIQGNGDTLISGNVVASAASFDHSLVKAGTGTLTISSTGSTLDGSVNIQNGTVAITDFRSITNNAATIHIGSSTTAGALVISGAAPAAGDITTSKVVNLAGTTGAGIIYANQTGINPVVFNANFTATGAGSKTLVLGGTNTADNIINGVIPDNVAANRTGVTKVGAGTWVLAGTNTYTGATTIANGTLKLKALSGSSNIIPSAATNTVVFAADPFSPAAGGTLSYLGFTTGSSETLGALTASAGAGTVLVKAGTSGNTALTFTSLVTPTIGTGLNLTTDVTGGGTATITLTGAANLNGMLNPHIYFNGANFAAGSAVGAASYTDRNTSFPTPNASNTLPYRITGPFSQTANSVVNGGFKFDTAQTITINNGITLTVRTATNGPGGILVAGGVAAVIANAGSATGLTTGGTGDLVIRTNSAADSLTINVPLTNGTTGGLTKNGAGTLILSSASNAQTGTTTINEGTIQLSGSGRLSAANVALMIRQGGTLDLFGVASGTAIGNFNGAGVVTNSSPTTAAVLTIGNSVGSGIFSGILQDGASNKLLVTKTGTGLISLSGLNTYTGVTTLTGGSLAVSNLANIGTASGLGRGDATSTATNAASLVFNGGALIYTGATTTIFQLAESPSLSINRLFTLAGNGTIDSQGSFGNTALVRANNNATLIFNNTAPVAFSGTGARTLTLQGDSTGDNRIDLQLINNTVDASVLNVTKSGSGVWVLGNGTNSYTGATTINSGVLRAQTGSTLPTPSNLVLNGGVLESAGSLTRTLGTGGGNLNWLNGGFAASDSKLTVNLGSTPTWNNTANFVHGSMTLNSGTALAEVDIQSGFAITQGAAKGVNATTTAGSATVNLTGGSTTQDLAIGQTFTGNPNIPSTSTIASIISATQFNLNTGGGVLAGTGVATTSVAGGYREIIVNDNTNTNTDFASITGVISDGGTAGTLRKSGGGVLQLLGANTYTGGTQVTGGILVVNSLGNSAVAAGSSVGSSTGGNTTAQAITLGDGGTGPATLQYVGTGETSDRMIRLNTTTGSDQIHADGSGAIILTNVLNNMTAGAKTLFLRGSNAQANQITSNLADNGGTLGVTVDGGAMWVLGGNNTYTGVTSLNAGALGVGSNTAFGTGTVALGNAVYFAYGGDRTIANLHTVPNAGSQVFVGDYSLTLSGTLQSLGGNMVTTNNIGQYGLLTGKVLSFGNVIANSLGTGTGTWTINGPGNTAVTGAISNSSGTLNLTYNPTNTTNTLTLGGTNTYTGATTLMRGTTILAGGSDNHLPSTTVVTLGTGAISATLQLGDASGPSNNTIRSVAISGSGTSNSIVGGNSLPTPSALTVSPITNFTMPIPIGGTTTDSVLNNLKFVKTGTAILTFTLTNWYTGGTDVGTPNGNDGGTLAVTASGSLGNIFTPPVPLSVYGGLLDIQIGAVGSPEVSNLNLGGGGAGSAARVSIEKDLIVHGDITYNATNNPQPATIFGNAALALQPPLATPTTITVGSSSAGSGALAPDLTISAAITGSNDIRKAGPGTLRLVANTGTTWQAGLFVDAGTLILDGSNSTSVLAQNTQVTVGLGSAGAKLDFGASSGEQTVFNTLTVNSNSTLIFNLGAVGTTTSDNLFLVNNDGLTLGTGLKINVNALSGFGIGHYDLIDELHSSDPGVPFTLGTKPGGFGYTLGHTYDAGTDQYLLFLDVTAVSPGFFWKGGQDDKWNTIVGSSSNWVDAQTGGVVINGVPGLVNDVVFSADSPANQVTTIVDVNIGVKTLTINDSLVATIQGVSSSILSIADGLTLNPTAGSLTLGSSTAANSLFIGVVNSQNWTNNGTGTLTVWNQVFSQAVTGTQTITFNGSGNSDIKGNITDGGLGGKIAIAKTSASTLTLENAGNTYTGGTTISAGTLAFTAGAIPATGTVEFINSGTLQWLGVNQDDLSDRIKIDDTRTGTLDVGSNNVTFASPIQNGSTTSGILRKIGSGTLKMANIIGGGYTGGTQIGAGTLEFVSGALPASTGEITFTGTSALKWSTGNTDDVSSYLSILNSAGVNATLDTNGNNVVFNNSAILHGNTSAGSLTKDGAGILTLNQPISVVGSGYTGGTNIKTGTLEFVSGAIPATGPVTFTGASTLRWLPGNTADLSARLKIQNSVIGTVDTNGNNVTFSSILQPGAATTGGLTKTGDGTLSLAANNTTGGYTGGTNINQGTVEFVSGGIPISTPTSTVTFTGSSTLRWLAGNTDDISARFNIQAGVTATLDTNGNNVTFASAMQSAGATNGSLFKTGGGTLTVAGSSPNFQGALSVDAGTLAVSGSLSGTASVSVSSGATLSLLGTGTNLINSAAPVSMGAGTAGTPATLAIDLHNTSQAMGVFTLAGTSVIDFGTSTAIAQMKFANSSGVSWTGPSLSIYNWNGNPGTGGGAEQLFFGSDSSGLTAAQLALISFYSDAGQTALGNATFASAGEVVPVPEPAGFAALFSGTGVLLALRRRRQTR